ncbi:phytoene desaturase family protein [Cytobacillus spongiae]|uniref:phytoene desaturase family protein n=1 Tax=Cytobacillus spongiae TaxID=2901381 RepID=UPI001F225C5D|nr:phytoene desaturase family protein [Cytobacillus spongiae]UII56960.1 phytoene desaturase family protein [Cytobacillus spongiae]
MAKNIIVIGAGPGGLAAAMLLSSKGYNVTVFEKQPFVGGRNGSMTIDGYTFDIGPTFLSMPHIAEELFEAANRNIDDYLQLEELETMYELQFDDIQLKMTRNEHEMYHQIETHFPGEGKGYLAFMKETKKKMDVLTPILQSKMDRYSDYLSLKVLKALPELSLGKSLYDVLSQYFTSEKLKLSFTFQSKYLGMSPWECPGAFSILSYMEHEHGIFHPIGGLNQLPKAMAKVTEEYGGEIRLNMGVEKLWLEGKDVKGVILENGEKIEADEVVINGDFAHVMTKLVEPGALKKYSPTKLEKKKYSCSTFMIYLGLNHMYNLPHHTICFAEDYKKNVEDITKTKTLSMDPSIYIQNASITDSTLAPKGKSALYILAPVPNNFSEIDWEKHENAFRDLVFETIERKTGFKSLRQFIEVEKIISPRHWEQDMHVYKGATFNLGHQLSQMMVLRPHNRFEELNHAWLVGGGTHPGSGLPTILESARITTRLIMESDGLKIEYPIQPKMEQAL